MFWGKNVFQNRFCRCAHLAAPRGSVLRFRADLCSFRSQGTSFMTLW